MTLHEYFSKHSKFLQVNSIPSFFGFCFGNLTGNQSRDFSRGQVDISTGLKSEDNLPYMLRSLL